MAEPAQAVAPTVSFTDILAEEQAWGIALISRHLDAASRLTFTPLRFGYIVVLLSVSMCNEYRLSLSFAVRLCHSTLRSSAIALPNHEPCL